MDQLTKDVISNILKNIGASEDEEKLVEYSNTPVTKDINHSQVITLLILSKQIRLSTEQFIQSNQLLVAQLKESTQKIISSNSKLAVAEDKNSKKMVALTWALVVVGVLQALSALISIFK